ncbi:MAG: LamG domain-containing protein [Myxococcota bacterium]|nr:LamG domain-containing protein [Myxococcota bacterium]
MKPRLRLLLIIFTMIISPPTPAQNTGELIAHWRFDNCDATDNSGNGHHGVIHGSPRCIDGILGRALEFKTGQYIEIPTHKFLDGKCNLTISTWINNRASDSQWHQVFAIGDERPENDPISMQFTAGLFNSEILEKTSLNHVGFGDTIADEAITIHPLYFDFFFNTNEWYLLSVVLKTSFESATMSIYVNDQRVYTVAKEKTICIRYDKPMQANISAIDNGKQGWMGYIDDFRIYNRALSNSDIAQLYNANAYSNKKIARSNESPNTSNRPRSEKSTDFTLIINDLDDDSDLDLFIITHFDYADLTETVWLNDGSGVFLLEMPAKKVDIFDHIVDHTFRYEIRSADLLKHDGCLDAFVLHPIDSRDQWTDDGYSSFTASGNARTLCLRWPEQVVKACYQRADPFILQRVLSEVTWSHL